jgi:molybdate transport system ATP-binding protein
MFWEVVHQSAAIAALHDRGLTNVLSATVVEHDHAHGVTRLSLDARCVLTAPLQDEHAKGTTVQIAIRPMDIALASSQISGISIQNQLAGVVRSCTEHAGRVLVEIDIGYPLLAEVSRRAVQSLSLEPGRPIWCLIKSNAITYLS